MLATLIANIASGETLLALRRAKVAFVVYAVVGALALIGLAFLLFAAWIALAAHFGPFEASLGLGGGFLASALLVFVAYRLGSHTRRKRAAARRKTEIATLAAASALALLPALASKASARTLLIAPLLAAIGYQILRENTRPPETGDDAPPPGDDE